MTSIAPLQERLDSAQDLHGSDPARAAALLHDAAELLPAAAAAEAVSWIRLTEHVLLGHLDDAARLRAELARVPPGQRAHAPVQVALERASLAMAWADDLSPAAPPSLSAADRVRALCTAAQMQLLRGRWREASERIARASALAAESEDAMKPYAINMNNMAVELRCATAPLGDEAVALMLDCAHRSRDAWGRAGGWIEAERAEYQLARCYARAGDGERALLHARRCHEACEANGGDALERFFGHEALLHAYAAAQRPEEARAEAGRMRQLFDAIAEADRAFAQEALDQATAALAA